MLSVTIVLDGYGYNPCKVTFRKTEDGAIAAECTTLQGVPTAGLVIPRAGIVAEWMRALFAE